MVIHQLILRCTTLLITALLIQAAARSKQAKGGVKTVLINHFKYLPDTLTVHQGDTVEWKNADIVPHTATATDGKAFDSGAIATGASWRLTITKAGTYDYRCTLHPNMNAKRIVQ